MDTKMARGKDPNQSKEKLLSERAQVILGIGTLVGLPFLLAAAVIAATVIPDNVLGAFFLFGR